MWWIKAKLASELVRMKFYRSVQNVCDIVIGETRNGGKWGEMGKEGES